MYAAATDLQTNAMYLLLHSGSIDFRQYKRHVVVINDLNAKAYWNRNT